MIEAAETAGNATVHVLIVERDHFSRFGLKQILSVGYETVVSAVVGTVIEAEQIASRSPVDVVLVGSDVIDMDGTEGIRRLLIRYPRAHVVVLGPEDDPAAVTTAIRGGADGYLPRSTPQAGLIRALHAVKRGEVAMPRSLMPLLFNALRVPARSHIPDEVYEHLSPREHEVFKELTRGRSNGEIAQRLNLKESTVKTHVSNILRKTGFRSRFAFHSYEG